MLEYKYIKINTDTWTKHNNIPKRWTELFLQLAMHMGKDGRVNPSGPVKTAILEQLDYQENNLYKGLKALCDCRAIKKIHRGWYEINKDYATGC